MQLGARWRAGEEPHRGVPPVLHAAIAEQEATHPEATAWTLTFLEGRPRCALDGLVTVTLNAAGRVAIEHADSLSADRFGNTADTDGSVGGGSVDVHDDEDDDWLS